MPRDIKPNGLQCSEFISSTRAARTMSQVRLSCWVQRGAQLKWEWGNFGLQDIDVAPGAN